MAIVGHILCYNFVNLTKLLKPKTFNVLDKCTGAIVLDT